MNIRPARCSDALAIATAHVQSWQEAYSSILPENYLAGLSVPDRTGRWERIIEAAESRTDVAEIDGQAVGFASSGHCRDEGAPSSRGEIWAIYVAPSAWGKGVGRALLNEALAALTAKKYNEVALWVLAANQRGRVFYEANGFVPVRESEKRFELGGVEVKELQYILRNAA